MAVFRVRALGSLAFSAALLGVTLPVACSSDPRTTVLTGGASTSAATTTEESTATGAGGSTLQFMDGPMTGTSTTSGGGDMSTTAMTGATSTSAMSSTGSGEGGTGTATYAWDATFTGTSASDSATVYDLAVDTQGNMIVVGAFKGSIDFDGPGGDPPATSKGENDIFVAKYSSLGQKLWVKTVGDQSEQSATAVTVDANDRVGLCGIFRGTLNFGGNNLNLAGFQYADLYAVVLDANGNHIASQRYGVGVGNSDACYGAAFDPVGNLVITGQYQGEINFGATYLATPTPGAFHMFLAKLAPNAVTKTFTEVFAKSYGSLVSSEETAQGMAVATASDGDIALGGFTKGTINFGNGPLEVKQFDTKQAVFARFDANGNAKFSEILDSAGDAQVNGVAFHTNGDLIVGGVFRSIIDLGAGSIKAEGPSNDIFLARFDKTNQLLFGVRFGSTAMGNNQLSDDLNHIAVDANGFPLVAGSFQGEFKVNSKSKLQGMGFPRDGLVLKVANTDGHGYWGYGFGDSALQETRGVGVDGAGNVIIAGSFEGTIDLGGGPRTAPNGSRGIFLGRFLP